jgi:hypothetical protein
MNFTNSKTQYSLLDLGGVRSERRKWINWSESVHKIIFTVDIAAYDEVLIEESSANRMREALVLFDFICNSTCFSKTQFIIFLHKVDKLQRKLEDDY